MKKIFKYKSAAVDRQIIFIESPANILSVAQQQGNIVLYSLVEENGEKIPIDVLIIGTGNPIPFDIDSYNFIGTVNLYDGKLIFHVFYRRSCIEIVNNVRNSVEIFGQDSIDSKRKGSIVIA